MLVVNCPKSPRLHQKKKSDIVYSVFLSRFRSILLQKTASQRQREGARKLPGWPSAGAFSIWCIGSGTHGGIASGNLLWEIPFPMLSGHSRDLGRIPRHVIAAGHYEHDSRISEVQIWLRTARIQATCLHHIPYRRKRSQDRSNWANSALLPPGAL